MPSDRQPFFQSDLEDLHTLLDFDVVFISSRTDDRLKQNIKRDGVVIMDKVKEKFQKLTEAVERLKEALDDYDRLEIDSVRDGAIQRFEFCTELSWKTTREYLLNQGYTDINSPKAVMKKAYADGLINDESIWIDLLNARNVKMCIRDRHTVCTITICRGSLTTRIAVPASPGSRPVDTSANWCGLPELHRRLLSAAYLSARKSNTGAVKGD